MSSTFRMFLFLSPLFSLSSAAEEASKIEPKTPLNEYKNMVFVCFRDQFFADSKGFPEFCAKFESTPREKVRAMVIPALKKKAEASMAAWKKSPVEGIEVMRACWLVNGFLAEATSKAALESAAKRQEVLFICRVLGGEGVRVEGPGDVPAEVYGALNRDGTVKVVNELAFDAKAQKIGESLEVIQAPGAWSEGPTGRGVTAAVFDAGVYPACADLRDAMWVNSDEIPGNGKDDDANGVVDDVFGANFETRKGNIVARAMPDMSAAMGGKTSHGHMCAGMIAGRGKTGTVTGVAPRARIMAIIGSTDLWIEGLEYVLENGGDIVSMSFMNPQSPEFRSLWRRQAEHAAAAGLFLCGGAGNNGYSTDLPQIFNPKDIPSVMAGAGVDLQTRHSPFSSRGPVTWSDVPFFLDYPLSAPLLKPDVCACASGFLGIMFDGPAKEGAHGNSFSGPQIAGCAALLVEANPSLNPWQIQRIINETATDLGAEGWDPEFGWGLLNCHKAVLSARQATNK